MTMEKALQKAILQNWLTQRILKKLRMTIVIWNTKALQNVNTEILAFPKCISLFFRI